MNNPMSVGPLGLRPEKFVIPFDHDKAGKESRNQSVARRLVRAHKEAAQSHIPHDNVILKPKPPFSADQNPQEGRVERTISSKGKEYQIAVNFEPDDKTINSWSGEGDGGRYVSKAAYKNGNVDRIYEKRIWDDGTVEQLFLNINDNGTLTYEARVSPPDRIEDWI